MATRIQMRRDTAANWAITSPAPRVLAQGEFGVETDGNRFKIGDGSTPWNSLRYAAQTYQFNVKDYGAVGDGQTDDNAATNSNDDTVAIQAAIDAAAAAGGGVVFIPSGVYQISAPLLLPAWKPIIIKGEGFSSKIRAKDGANLSAVFMEDELGAGKRAHMLVFQDFAINGNNFNTNLTVKGIYLCAHTCFFDRIWVYNCYDGIHLNRFPPDSSEYWGNNVISSCQVTNCDHQAFQIPVDSTIQNSGLGEIGVRSGQNQDWETSGVYVASWDCRIIGNHFWGVNGPVIWSNYNEHIIIANNVMERTYAEYIWLRGRSYLASITGNVFEDKVIDGSHAAEALNWMSVPFIRIDNDVDEKDGLIVSNNSFAELLDVPRQYVIKENANVDYGLYHGNLAIINPETAFTNTLGANSVSANNLIRVLPVGISS